MKPEGTRDDKHDKIDSTYETLLSARHYSYLKWLIMKAAYDISKVTVENSLLGLQLE